MSSDHMGPARGTVYGRTTPGDLLIGGEGQRYDGPKSDLPLPYPKSNEVDVFHNYSYVIVSVSCRN